MKPEGFRSMLFNRMMLFIFLFLLGVCIPTLAKEPRNFQEAKKMARIIWNEQRQTFYCGCRYDKHGVVDFKSCSYIPSNSRKDKKISWEHVVPVSWLGQQRACWQSTRCLSKTGKKLKGRACCQQTDKQFNQMEADLHNLVPAIREVNSARKNYRFGEFYLKKGEDKFNFNHCKIIIDDRYQVVEPCDDAKGMVARIHFYMAKEYNLELSEQQKRLLSDWDKRFPPSSWELKWNEKVAKIYTDRI